jgi:hypothetical protein
MSITYTLCIKLAHVPILLSKKIVGIFHASSGNNTSANENAQRLSVSYFAFIEAERQAG